MANIKKKIKERIIYGLKKYQKILESAKIRDFNESDTVIIVSDIMADVLGYDKYMDLTTEFAIRSTFCDLAVKIGDKVQFLVEVKAIGIDLKESHIKQAVDYAANKGIDWTILTNGQIWHVYKISFQKPIEHELVFDIDFLNVNPKDPNVIEKLFLISKEGIVKSAIEDFQRRQQATNRFTIAAVIQSDTVINVIRRELKRIFKGIKIDKEQLAEIIRNDVIKRDIIEDERTHIETKKICRKKPRRENKTVSIVEQHFEHPHPKEQDNSG